MASVFSVVSFFGCGQRPRWVGAFGDRERGDASGLVGATVVTVDTGTRHAPSWPLTTLAPLSFACPKCGSPDVIYSCSPACCFNHVCSRCYATFEPETARVGEFRGEIGSLPEIDTTGPTAPCARCGEYKLFKVIDAPESADQLVCAACRALLTLELKVLEAD